MTENEKKFVNKYLDYYKKFNGNTSLIWPVLGFSDFRESLGISLERSIELANEAVKTLNQNDNNMDENSVVKIFKRELGDWLGLSSDYDCATYKNHYKNGNMYIPQYKANFKIGIDEEVLFTRDTSSYKHNQGLVITDKAIYVLKDNDYPDEIIVLAWEDFDQVVYHDEKFSFYSGSEEIIWLYSNLFVNINKLEKIAQVANLFVQFGSAFAYINKLEKIAQVLTKMAQSVQNPLCSIRKLLEMKMYKEALQIANELIAEDSSNVMARYYKCTCLYCLGIANDSLNKSLLNDSLREGEVLLKLLSKEEINNMYPLENINRGKSRTFQAMAKCSESLGNKEKAREYLVRALDIDELDEEKEVIKKLDIIENELQEEWSRYTEKHSYQERRLIMLIKDECIGGCVSDDIQTFRKSHIPSDIVFQTSVPTVNQLYIGHKYDPKIYVPFDQSEEYFFLDKVDELCNLLQCLGAKTITIKRITGKDIGELYKGEFELKGNVGHKIAEAEAQYKKEKNNNRKNEKKDSYERCLTYDKPTKLPYIPDDLHWFHHIKKWQNIANERVQNGGKVGSSFHECISTSETRFYSSSELDSINAAVKILLVKASGSMNNKEEKEYKESTNTEWSVDVDFWALDEFGNNKASQTSQDKWSDNEKKYKEEVLFYLEDDGIIDDEERRFLERKRVRLGISEDRAKEIEEECMPQLTSEEKEYLEALKELGEVDLQNPRIRRMLDHERDDLGISEERASELEKQYCYQ